MVLGDVIVGHNGDVRALQKRLNEIAGARQQTGSDFDVITARVKRDPNGLLRLVGGFLVHSLCFTRKRRCLSSGLGLGGVRFYCPLC